jgi:gas vesicle protein
VSDVAAWWSQYWDFVVGIVIGGVLGFLANWFFYRKSKKSKRLSWEGLSRNRIIQASASARKNFTVSYGGAEVKDPNALAILVMRLFEQKTSPLTTVLLWISSRHNSFSSISSIDLIPISPIIA